MKKTMLLCVFVVVLFLIAGCAKNKDNGVKTKLSCYKDFTLFHSKQHIENKIYLDKNNKLIDYEYIESYSEFDSDNEYNMICNGSKDEAENNNKLYEYLTQSSNCDSAKRIVNIYNKYDLSKVSSKNNLEGKNMKNFLDDNYVLDLENYKRTITDKGYTCE